MGCWLLCKLAIGTGDEGETIQNSADRGLLANKIQKTLTYCLLPLAYCLDKFT
jgi:hypothetical protein